MAGPLNMSNNKITHLAQTTANGDAVDFEFIFNKYSPTSSRDKNDNFNFDGRILYNINTSNNDTDVVNVRWVRQKYLFLSGGNITGVVSISHAKNHVQQKLTKL